MEIKSLRPLLVLGLPLMFAGCAMWKPTPKPAPPPAETPRTADDRSAPRPPATASTPPAETVPAVPRPGGTENKFVPEIDFSTPYGSVKRHGRLIAVGNRIVGEHGLPVSVAGNSFFWSQWQGQFFNADVVKWLKLD